MKKMKSWKKGIFYRAILARMEAEDATREEILATYPKLAEYEKDELRAIIPETLQGNELEL